MRLAILIFLLIPVYIFAQEPNSQKPISCHVSDASFNEFCNEIYNKSGVKIYFSEIWVENIKVSISEDSISVKSALELALKETDLQVSVWNKHLIILPGEKLIDELPEFAYKKNIENNAGKKDTLTDSEEIYLKGRQSIGLTTLRIGAKGTGKSKANARVRLRIIDLESGEPIIGATSYVKEIRQGKISGQNGYINLVVKPGKYNLSVASLGFEKKELILDVASDGKLNIELTKKVESLEEVVVHGDRQMNIMSSDPGLVKIPLKTIKEIPTLMGERDILKISEMLPGIVSVGEGSAGLNVRGGNSDQNAFYINKIPIYNTSHLFGFFPAFNSDIIKDFSIFKGHVPSQYGGRLSSVFNIITKQGNRKKFGLSGGINPITANLTVEGPIKKDVCTFLLSARSSYSDWILSRINDPLIRNSSANFSDYTASLNYDFENTNITAFAYYSNDFFQLSDINSYSYSNSGASLNARHEFTPSLQANFAIIGSRYEFDTKDLQSVSSAYEHGYKIEHYEFRGDFEHSINEKLSLKYGVSSILYKLYRGEVVPLGPESLRSSIDLGSEQSLENAIYFSGRYNMFDWLNINLGVRHSMYTPIGPTSVNVYAENVPRDERYINDTLLFSNTKPIKWYSQPDIRAVVNIITDDMGSIKIAFNQMHQNLFMLSNTITVAPNTQWKLADYHLKPTSSNQLSLGVFRNFRRGGWESSIEFFYKETENFSEFKDGADFLASPNVEKNVLQGNQHAYGVEFFIKRSRRKFNGWLSYTYSKSFVQIDGPNQWDKINQGKKYPSNYDIPHAFNTVLNYHLTRRITASSIVTYQTGRPITYPVAAYYIDDKLYTDYSDRNAYRIPDYFRVDFSLTIEGSLKRKKLIHSSWMFSIYNLTGRKNPYSIYFEREDNKINSYKYSVIGVPFFTITWLFKLGNYASN